MAGEGAAEVPHSRFFILALGLLVGFVTGFVVLLANLPVDPGVVDYQVSSDQDWTGNESRTQFDFYEVLSERPRRDELRTVAATAQPAAPGATAIDFSASQASTTQAPAAQTPSTQASVAQAPGAQFPATQNFAAPQTAAQQNAAQQPVATIIKPATRTVPGTAQIAGASTLAEQDYSAIPVGSMGRESYYLQAGSFRQPDAAERQRAAVLILGLDAFIVTRQEPGGALGHRVRIGPYFDQGKLTEAKKRLRRGNVDYEIVRVTG